MCCFFENEFPLLIIKLLLILLLQLNDSSISALINGGGDFSTTSNSYILSYGDSPSDAAVYHAFVQTGSELHYFKDISYQDSILRPIQAAAHKNDHENAKHKPIKLFEEEEFTDFGSTAYGVPVQRVIFINNPSTTKIVLSTVQAAGANFHCSVLEEKFLAPRHRTSFRVHFLPSYDEPATIEELLFLHTSIGKFVHKVRGEVLGNPYGIRPLSAIRLPLNATFSAPIQLHNPHPRPILLLEISTSDCNIHFESPAGMLLPQYNDTSNLKKFVLWPFQTREVAVAKIVGNVERNTTSFIFIKFALDTRVLLEDHHGFSSTKHFPESKIYKVIFPVETEVTLRRGIFATTNLLDFGLVKAGKPLTPLKLSVFSTLERGIEIESVYATDKTQRVYLQFETNPPISLKSAARGQPGVPVQIVNVNIDTNSGDKTIVVGELGENDEQLNNNKGNPVQQQRRGGHVMAESRGGNYNVTVPFRAQIYEGGIEFDPKELAFHYELKTTVLREITLTNTLPFALAIFGVELLEENAKNHFEAFLIDSPVIISPGQSVPSFLLQYAPRRGVVDEANLSAEESAIKNFSSQISLRTNLTTFKLPLFVSSGEIEITLHSLEQSIFNFGMLKPGESRSILFTLSNPNPISIIVHNFLIPPRFANFFSLAFVELTNNNKNSSSSSPPPSTFSSQNSSFSSKYSTASFSARNNILSKNFHLPPQTLALFKITLRIPRFFHHQNLKTEEPEDLFRILTHFSSYQFPLHFKISNSTSFLLSIPKKIVFNEAFVGGVYTQPLIVLSSLQLRLLRISIPIGDPRFLLSSTSTKNSSNNNNSSSKSQILIRPGFAKNIANLLFVPAASCPKNCYLGMPISSTDGQWFAYGMKLPQNLAEIDHYLYARLKRKWLALKAKSNASGGGVQTMVKVDTDKIRGFEIPVEANLIWPRLFSHSTIHFPLTAVGNFSILNLTISNPTTFPIIVQILPIVIYPDSESLLEFLAEELQSSPLVNPVELNETLMFSLRDTELFTLRPGSPTPQLREEVEKIVEGQIPRFTLSMLLRPGMSARVRVGFLPSDYSLRSSMLIIRNNLTAIEPVVLYGRGAQMSMEIDNKTARTRPLLFELEPRHLSDCANPRRQLHRMPTTLTVRRSFLVRNNGEVGFSVTNISINGMPCENRGYRVLNCDRFRLEPNETTYLDISYTPDFLFSINEATLQLYIHMNGTPWAFGLTSVIPEHFLGMCHSALPRPPFEALMYQTCILALMFCLICVISCAYLEGDRVVLCAYKQQFLIGQEVEVFDLNALEKAAGTTTKVVNVEDFVGGMEVGNRREFLKVSADSGIFKRVFLYIFNFVLWIFSYIWPLIRNPVGGGNKAAAAANERILKEKEAESSATFASPKTTYKMREEGEEEEEEFNILLKNKRIESNICSVDDFKNAILPTTLNDAKIQQRSKQKQRKNTNLASKLADEKRDVAQAASKGKELLMVASSKIKEQQQHGIVVVEALSAVENKPKIKERNLLEQNWNSSHNTGAAKLPLSGSSSISGGDATASSNDIIILPSSSFKQSSQQQLQLLYSLKKKNQQQQHSKGVLNNATEEGRKNSAQQQQQIYCNNKWKGTTKKEGEICSTSDEEEEEEEEEEDEDENVENKASDQFSEAKETSAEGEDIPEWADEEIEKGNADEDFNELAAQSALLLFDAPNDPIPSSEHILIDNNYEQLNNNNKNFQSKTDKNFHKDHETEKIIEQLTSEYRERLRRVFKNGAQLLNFESFLALPPDLSPAAIFDELMEAPPVSGSSSKSNTDDKSSNNLFVEEEEQILSMHRKPRRKSPGSELDLKKRGRKKSAVEKQREKNEEKEEELSQNGFLFNFSDPVWKPINAFDEHTTATGKWPNADFYVKKQKCLIKKQN